MSWEDAARARILDFFNSVQDAEEIVSAIKDDPDFGSDSPLAYGVRRDTANRVVDFLRELRGQGKKFTTIDEIDSIQGIGPDTLHDIYHTLAPPSQSYPALLFPVRIETRFIEDELRVRIYPDDILIQKHDGRLTPDEVDTLKQYRKELAEADPENLKEAWRGLVERVGQTRAAYMHRIEDIDAAGQKSDDWERSPYVRVLPDHFLVSLYQGDQLTHQVRGTRIRKDLPVMADPAASRNQRDPLYGEHAKWIYDFDEAKTRGLAVRIKLSKGESEFSRVVVLGLNKNSDPQVGQDLVERLIEDHRFTSGLSFVPYGTPTNNTEQLATDYTANEDAESSFRTENQDLGDDSIGIAVASALGIYKDTGGHDGDQHCPFAYVRNAAEPAASDDADVRGALWPALGDLCLDRMFQPSMPSEYRRYIWRHFQYFVQPRGPYEALRVGKQPYSILPVTDLSAWQASEQDDQALDDGNTGPQEFFQKFHDVLMVLYRYWLSLAEDPEHVPRIGQSGDTDEELLQILAMQPASISQNVRAMVDDRFMAWLIKFVGDRFFGEGTNIEPGTGTDDPKQLWGQLLYESQAGARVLLKEMAGELGIGEEDILQSPMLRLFGWGESVPLWNEEAQEIIPFVADVTSDDPFAYLGAFQDGGIPPADVSKPLLFDLLRRALVYQTDEQHRLADPGTVEALVRGVATKFAESEQKDKQIVEAHVADVLDSLTHRLDAWISSLSIKRLKAMRNREGYEEGIYVGAYGWVENLVRDRQTFSENSGGYIHAPSLGQSAAGAIWRNACLSEIEEEQDGNPLRINLSSSRVRRALRIIDGRRQGQELGAILGVQYEGSLHDAKLDQYIDNFRAIYPLVGQKVTEPDGTEAVETIAARNVVDGLKLVRDWERYQSDATPDVEKARIRAAWGSLAIDNLANDPNNQLTKQLNYLLDSLDGVTDLLLYESVYQEVRGNYERSAATLDAMSGDGLPPEPESIQTPKNGVSFTQRLALMFDSRAGASQGYRANAEPTLARWFGGILGDMTAIGCIAQVLEYRDKYDEVASTEKIVNLNQASFAELEGLPGIGTSLAQEIIDDREENGYYTRLEDLKRIDGIGDSRLEGLVGLATVEQLELNQATEAQLQELLAINDALATAIVEDRTNNSHFSSVNDLIRINVLDDRTFERIKSRLMVTTERLVNLNHATLEELESLPGIGTALAQEIIDDREENGYYERMVDLKRIDGIGDAKLEALADVATVEKLELNREDKARLQELLLIGEALATAIVEDRNNNGPFSSVNDLKRINVLDESTFDRIKGRLMVTMVDINVATEEELARLPGIEEARAKAIVDDRNAEGRFASLRDLARIDGIGDGVVDGLQGVAFVAESLAITLDDLNLKSLDFLYLSHAPPPALATALGFKQPPKKSMRAGTTEIEQRIRYHFSEQNLVDPNCVLTIDFYPTQSVFPNSIGNALEMARYVLELLANASRLSPLSLRRAEEAGSDPAYLWDYQELHDTVTKDGRVDVALDALKALKDDPRWDSDTVDPNIYFELGQFGIDNAIPPSPFYDPHPDRRKAMLDAMEKRIKEYEKYIVEADRLYSAEAPMTSQTKAVENLEQAMKALFGGAFVTLPVLRRGQTDESKDAATELRKASRQTQILGSGDEQRIYQWMQQVAQTHSSIRHLETGMMTMEAWQQPIISDSTDCKTAVEQHSGLMQWNVLQLPYDDERRWLALSDAELEAGLSSEEIDARRETLADDGRERGVLAIVTISPQKLELGTRITGLLIDEWNEWLPAPTLRTGVTFQYDRPNAQAPQALLLAVPPVWEENDDRPWTYQTLLNVVNDTINLAKVRAVDIDALGSAESRLFPAALMPSDPENPGWVRDTPMPGLDEWLTIGPGCVDFRSVSPMQDFSDRQEGRFHFRTQQAQALVYRRPDFGDVSFLRILNEGIVITLDQDVTNLKAVVAVFPAGDTVRLILESADGRELARLTPPATMRPVTITRDVSGIRKITITGGGGQLALFEICVS